MIKKFLLIIFLFSTGGILTSFDKPVLKQKILKTIIIDAGHGIMPGGGHNGAKGSYSYEDDICLAVSLKLVDMIRAELPDINIVQTRTDNEIVPLHERANIANRSRGDLFISIHANAAPPIQHREFLGYRSMKVYVGKGKKKHRVTKKVPEYRYYTTPNPQKGTETYIWGSHKNEDKEVAIRENAPMLSEENFEQNYGNIDPNSPEFIALSLLKTKQFFKRSATLASFVEDQFFNIGRASRGQKQRQVGIWVLQATAMPSVLVETGFITNKEEEDYLNSNEGQTEIVRCITEALKTYVNWLEKQQQTGTENTGNNDTKNRIPAKNDTRGFLEMIDQKEKANYSK